MFLPCYILLNLWLVISLLKLESDKVLEGPLTATIDGQVADSTNLKTDGACLFQSRRHDIPSNTSCYRFD